MLDDLKQSMDEFDRKIDSIKSKVELLLRLTDRYRNGLAKIAYSRDDMNPLHLKQMAQSILDGEPTTADEHNRMYISDVNKEISKEMKKETVHGPNDPGDEHVKKKSNIKETELDKWRRDRLVRFGGDTGTDADFKKEVDIINEQAEAEYRGTVLHPEYNSEDDTQLGASIVKSNDNVEGVFISNGEVKQVDYFDEEE